MLLAQGERPTPRRRPRDPLALAGGGRDLAVEAHRPLEGDLRTRDRTRFTRKRKIELDRGLAPTPRPRRRSRPPAAARSRAPRPGCRDRGDRPPPARFRRARARRRRAESGHGGSRARELTKSVAPRARSPAAASARISACGSPARRWKPSPTTLPSRTRTAPTIGFGAVVSATACGERQGAAQRIRRRGQRRTPAARTRPGLPASPRLRDRAPEP